MAAMEQGRSEVSVKARRLHRAFEPIAGSVYFAPEVHAAFEALGFGPPATARDCVTLPDLPAYFCSRAGCMGQVPGEVVVAAFGIFNPDLVIPAVAQGWRQADRDSVLVAREQGQIAFLERVLGGRPGAPRATQLLRRAADAGSAGGRFLFAGLRSLGFPGHEWGDLWRGADLLREFRGDAHIAAWTAAGLDPVEAGLTTELYFGMPSKQYHASRGWRGADLDAGLDRLRDKGWIVDDPARFTAAGRAGREAIEVATDEQQRPFLDALGDDYEELLSLLEPWVAAIVEAGGYPSDVRQIPAHWGRLPD